MAESKSIKEVLRTAVTERLVLHPNQWTGEDSAKVNESLVSNTQDEKGKPIVLTELEKDVITLASRPTQEVQVRVIKRIVEGHGGKFDADLEKRVKDVVNPTIFKAKLKESGHIKGTGDTDVLE